MWIERAFFTFFYYFLHFSFSPFFYILRVITILKWIFSALIYGNFAALKLIPKWTANSSQSHHAHTATRVIIAWFTPKDLPTTINYIIISSVHFFLCSPICSLFFFADHTHAWVLKFCCWKIVINKDEIYLISLSTRQSSSALLHDWMNISSHCCDVHHKESSRSSVKLTRKKSMSIHGSQQFFIFFCMLPISSLSALCWSGCREWVEHSMNNLVLDDEGKAMRLQCSRTGRQEEK